MPRPNGKSNASSSGPASSGASNASSASDEWAEIEKGLGETEIRLRDLKDRYGQVRRDLRMREELGEARSQFTAKPQAPETRQELKKIDEELDQIELALESRLFQLDQAFWQAVRFGGLGVVLGWLLKAWAG